LCIAIRTGLACLTSLILKVYSQSDRRACTDCEALCEIQRWQKSEPYEHVVFRDDSFNRFDTQRLITGLIPRTKRKNAVESDKPLDAHVPTDERVAQF